MFTGIVQERGRVRSLRREGEGAHFEVEAGEVPGEISIGDSVSVNGVCQTVTKLSQDSFQFFAMGETLRATNFEDLREGSPVNLELALTPTSRLGGHFVTGHVDGTARIAGIRDEGNWSTFTLEMEEDLASQLVPKGSIAIDGISLTVGPEVREQGCELYIIPHTLEVTTLGKASAGQRVNVETDLIGKYVLQYVERGESRNRDSSLMELLAGQGFLGKDGK
ncbi:MAG: riboflavin synthase [Candidatus Krumholzibacteria bacterium]|jgi:riboflavin synthase|nr:riboflavin synthase [Candidatus Krumholzibacteria bacterium]MDP6797619.1 riboflavin synthase [Candidatus Krumholzibacteria bacterium]MDP7021650.1 riboflavin synthase [Candidatus Krumholzibacteria bacterium]